jgi:ATP-dependent protease ClpP protease subunit
MLACVLAAACGLAAAQGRNAFREGIEAFDRGRYAEAYALWLPLARGGSAAAQFNIAALLEKGLGVAADPAEAAHWYLQAAERGDAQAQLKIAGWYEAGTGVTKDLEKAREWYTRAAAGRPDAPETIEATRRLAALPPATSAPPQEVIPFEDGRYVIQPANDGICFIALQGMVNRSTTYLFERATSTAAALGCRKPLTLVLESPGGGHFDGLAIGRSVRLEGMKTLARYDCASACATIFLGGVERVLYGSRAVIGLHQVAQTRAGEQMDDRRCVQSRESESTAELRKYLRFVASDNWEPIMQVVMATSCKSIEWIRGQRALDLGIATAVERPTVDVFGPREAAAKE